MFDRYISHPGDDERDATLLFERTQDGDATGHLPTVAERMARHCQGQRLSGGCSADRVATVIGYTHDFAKLTRWAQRHLRGRSYKQPETYRYHAFPSALVTQYCLSVSSDEIDARATEVATLVVAGHHNTAAPPEPSEMARRYGRLSETVQEKYRRLAEQWADIDDHAAELADRIIQTATNGAGSWAEFRAWFDRRVTPLDGAHEHLRYFAGMGDGDPETGYYGDVVRLWTALKFADQTAASRLDAHELTGDLPDRTRLDTHVAALDEGEGVRAELNRLRDCARQRATANVTEILDTDIVGLITLPTSFGKTYAGLSAGLTAADRRDSRLVYVLPYTSILDQTAKEIQSIFQVSPYSNAFTVHHHLSETYTGLGGHHTDADIGRSPGRLHAESWLSGLTLTTTVQLFESIAAPTARQATRVPALQDAVVVIDEPQTIPEGWWQLVPRLIELLVETYDATVILMTATQPGLVEYGSRKLTTRELSASTEQCIAFLDRHPRVRYRLHETVRDSAGETAPLSHATAGRAVAAATRDDGTVLAVCNTRTSAEALYEQTTAARATLDGEPLELNRLLYDRVVETGSLPSAGELRRAVLDRIDAPGDRVLCAFLSGNVRPDDRSLLIDVLYNDAAGGADDPGPLLDTLESVALVSTSVVEAGVDISFDAVFRDYAPVPSIVQSGGRCNRSFGGATGQVTVWRLDVPPGGSLQPSIAIHGSDGGDELPLLYQTGRVLRRYATDDGTIDEATMVSDVVSDFYESLFTGTLDPGNEQLVAALETASMSDLAGEHMIEDIAAYEDTIVPLTEHERSAVLDSAPTATTVSSHAGAQVTADPTGSDRTITIGNAVYHILDGRGDSYHPVYGVR